MKRNALHVFAALTLSFSLAACGGSDEKKDEAKKDSSKETSEKTGVEENKTSPKNLPKVPGLKKGWDGAFKDVKFGECPTKNGDVELDADVTNSTSRPQDYVVVVSWINGSNDVMGRAVQTVNALPAGESKKVTLSTKLDAPVKVTCTYNVSRGSLAKG